jgi:hypothetical protein
MTQPPPPLGLREVVELARKLILTSLLALVQPGSATQGAPRALCRAIARACALTRARCLRSCSHSRGVDCLPHAAAQPAAEAIQRRHAELRQHNRAAEYVPRLGCRLRFLTDARAADLFFFMFVALLLKVQVDGSQSDSSFFTAIVGVMSIAPVVLPIALKLLMKLSVNSDQKRDMKGIKDNMDDGL